MIELNFQVAFRIVSLDEHFIASMLHSLHSPPLYFSRIVLLWHAPVPTIQWSSWVRRPEACTLRPWPPTWRGLEGCTLPATLHRSSRTAALNVAWSKSIEAATRIAGPRITATSDKIICSEMIIMVEHPFLYWRWRSTRLASIRDIHLVAIIRGWLHWLHEPCWSQ